MPAAMLTLVDNFDSFVHTLADYCRAAGAETRVVRNDAVGVEELRRADAVLLSPGPGRPEEAGVCVEAVRRLGDVPVLGVCLGHQAIAAAFGGTIIRVPPRHGRSSRVVRDGGRVLEGLPDAFEAARYHSLAAEEASLPGELRVVARSEGGVVMAVEHIERPVFGVQFHPESVLSEYGRTIVGNFLHLAGLIADRPPPQPTAPGLNRPAAGDDFYARPADPRYPAPSA